MIDHDPSCVLLQGQHNAIPLHNACRHGHFNVVKVLVEHKLITEPDRYEQLKAVTRDHRQTPLHYATLFGHVKLVSFLLEFYSKLKIDLRDLKNRFGGNTPVHTAAYGGRKE